MNECRKFGCTSAALPYPRYEGYCSFQCQDVGELDDEIAELKAEAKKDGEKYEQLSEEYDKAEKMVLKLEDELRDTDRANGTLHSLMKSGENRGAAKGEQEIAELKAKLAEAEAKVKELGEQIEYYRWLNRALEIDNKHLASDAGQNPFDTQKNYYIEMVAFRERLSEAEALAKHWEHIATVNGKELETVHGQLDEALSLIDGAKPLVEIFESGGGSWDAWRSDWLERAVKLLKEKACSLN